MYGSFASNFTHNTLAATRVITAGSVHVYGLILNNADSANVRTVTLEDADGNDIIVITLGAEPNFDTPIQFLAPNGLTILSDVADADVTFTIFHSNTAGAA